MQTMDCVTFRSWWEGLGDSRTDAALQEALEVHRAGCERCADYALGVQQQRRAVRSLTPRPVPIQLAVNLRVLASKERARRSGRLTWAAQMEEYRSRLVMWVNNLCRPVAIPAAGGVLSACVLFAALMPALALQGSSTADVPTAWYQAAEVYGLSPFGGNFDNVTLDVRIDTSGRVVDYAIPAGEPESWQKDVQMRKAVEQSLLFMTFKPASFFGQPAADTIRITLRRSHIEVKG